MALRNAFGDLGLEGTLRSILRAVTFPRDTSERLRVSVDTWPGSVIVYANGSNVPIGSVNIIPHSSGSFNVTDAREDMMIAMQSNYINQRNRWSIT